MLLQQRRVAVAEPVNTQPVEPVGPHRPTPLPVLDRPGVLSAEPATEWAQQPVPSPAAGEPDVGDPGAPPGRGGLEERARELLAAGGRPPGRRVLARQLGVSEHQARTVLATVATRDTHHPNGSSGVPAAEEASPQ